MPKIVETNNGDKGGLLVGNPHNDKNGNAIGGMKAKVVDTNQIVEVEGNEAVINPEASKKHWKELSKINQSAGNGVPITPPNDYSEVKPNKNGNKNEKDVVITNDKGLVKLKGGSVIINKKATAMHFKKLSKINQSAGDGVEIKNPNNIEANIEADVDEYKRGGRTIEFNPNHLPSKFLLEYASRLKKEYPDIWKLGGNEFGNEAFKNLERVFGRGYWLDSEEWFYVKWQSFNARHKGDFRIAGVIANLKWLNRVDKGWKYMKSLIEEEIKKRGLIKMKLGGKIDNEDEKKKLKLRILILTNRSFKMFSGSALQKKTIKEINELREKYEKIGGIFLVGGELKKDIEVEKEHTDVAQKNYDHEISPEKATEEIAKSDLIDIDNHYSKLNKIKKLEGEEIIIVKKPFFIDEHRKVIDNKNTVKIEKIKKDDMETDIFYNPDIFVEEGDYVLGGFNAEDLNSIEVVGDISAFSYPKLKFIFEKRLKNAIENFKKEIRSNVAKSRDDIENVNFDKEIYDELSNLTETYLSIKLNNSETNDIANQIMEDSSYTTWGERIKERVNSYKLRVVSKHSDVNENKPSSVSVKDAEYDTQTATLEQMLERLFNINEENTY